MGKHLSSRLTRTVASCAAVGALVLSASGGFGVGRAASGARSALAAGAGVFVDATVSKDLWVLTLDPGAVTDVSSSQVISMLYNGLLRQSYNSKMGKFAIVPDLAASLPAVSKGGLVYIFKLRKDARFSDGSQVTAQDVVYSINRALLPAEKSPVASFYLADILGAADVAAGKAKAARGLKAIGSDTVEITLDKPVAYFLYSFTYPTSDVMKQNVAPAAKLTTDPTLIVGAGPFMVKNHQWKYRSQITLVPNPYYYNAKRVQLKEIDIPFVGTVETGFKAYQSGQYPIALLPAIQVTRFRGKPEFHSSPTLGDLWYAMNPKVAPFNNLHFRRAIAFAINRDAIVKGVEHNTQIRLDGWYPKGILGYDPTVGARVPHYNPAMARKELAMAMKTLTSVPSIQLEYPSDTGDWTRDAAQVQSDLKAVGITLGLRSVPGNAWLRDVSARKTPFILNNWFDDYPDPQDFSEVLVGTGGGSNAGNYSNPQVDALFAKADVARDVATRERLYRQAQEIIMNDAAVVMLYQFAGYAVWSTKLHGLELNPSGFYPVSNDWTNVSVSG